MDVANKLIASFGKIVGINGGSLRLIDADESVIRIGYSANPDAQCEAGVCTLTQAELEDMMRGWLVRLAPNVLLTVEPFDG